MPFRSCKHIHFPLHAHRFSLTCTRCTLIYVCIHTLNERARRKVHKHILVELSFLFTFIHKQNVSGERLSLYSIWYGNAVKPVAANTTADYTITCMYTLYTHGIHKHTFSTKIFPIKDELLYVLGFNFPSHKACLGCLGSHQIWRYTQELNNTSDMNASLHVFGWVCVCVEQCCHVDGTKSSPCAAKII